MTILPKAETYEEVYGSFRWPLPARFNIADACIDRHAAGQPDATALIHETADGAVTIYSFLDIQRLANRFANLLVARGVSRGERVAIQLSQCPEMAIAFIGSFKVGAVAIPISVLFGEEALEYRLNDASVSALVTDCANYPKLDLVRERLPAFTSAILIDGLRAGALDFHAELERAADTFESVDTSADDAAFLSYTSGTTGPPKGALHAHRNIIGHLPGHDILHNFYGQDGDLSWSPADWAWMGGLTNVLLTAWWHGKPVLSYRGAGPYDPDRAYAVMARHKVRNSFFVPTMMKLMREARVPAGLSLRSLFSAGESVGAELIEWGRSQFGIDVNEGYGQTECNLVLAHVPQLMTARPGALGRPVPGHRVAIVDDDGNEVSPGDEGHIAVRRPDPVMLVEYWNSPQATDEKFAGDWLITGDRGVCDEEGYFWFLGRADDVITSAGYRIGPGEIEECLLQHPAVALAAAIGVPDPVRTEIVKAFIVLAQGVPPGLALEEELREFVRSRLARHEVPRAIEFIDHMPTTTTGKVMRRVLKQRELDRLAR